MNCDESFDLLCDETIELDAPSLGEIYFKEYLLPRETDGISFLSQQQYITNYMRGILVDWLIEVSEDFRLQRTTLYLAVTFVDNYLSKVNNTEINEFQLLGITALFIAQKIEEVRLRTVQDFIRSTSNSYTKMQLFEMELKLCQTLNWNLLFVTPIMVYDYFFDQLLSLINNTSNTELQHSSQWLYIKGCDLMDRLLLDGESSKFRPSQIAASIYYVLYEDFGLTEEQIEGITEYPVRLIHDCYCYVYTIYKLSFEENIILLNENENENDNVLNSKPLFNQIWNNKSLQHFQEYEKLLLQRRVSSLIPPLIHDNILEDIPILNLSPPSSSSPVSEKEEKNKKILKPESNHDNSILSMNEEDISIDGDISMSSIIETLNNNSTTTTSSLKRNADSNSESEVISNDENNKRRRRTLN